MSVKGYIRVSTLEQAGKEKVSLDQQKDSIISYAQSQGLTPPSKDDFYLDTSSGGRMDDRPELQRLLLDITKGKVKHIFVWKLDRLSRSACDTLLLFKKFESSGVRLRSVTEPIDNTGLGKALMAIIAVFAEMERESIKERMLGGRYAKVDRDGTNFGSEPPFGYTTLKSEKQKKFVIVESEAIVVRTIFDLYLKFRSQSKVVEYLANNEITARVNLDRRQIKRILANVKYTGCMEVKGKIYSQKHPPIVSMEDFKKVQEIRDKNYTGNMPKWTNIAPNLIFRDVARCGECGRQLTRQGVPSQKKGIEGTLEYYRCSSKCRKETRSKCRLKNIRKEKLEAVVIDKIFKHIEELVADPAYLQSHLNITSKEQINTIKEKIDQKNQVLTKKKKARQRYMEVLETGDDAANDFLERYKSLGKEIYDLEDDIGHLKVSLEVERIKKDKFKQKERYYQDFRQNWLFAETAEKRTMINNLVKVLKIYSNGESEIHYNF